MKKYGRVIMRVWRDLNALFIWATLMCPVIAKIINKTWIGQLFNSPGTMVTVACIVAFVGAAFIALAGQQPKNDEWRLGIQVVLVAALFIIQWLVYGKGVFHAIWCAILAISVYVEYIGTDKYGGRVASKKKRREYTPKKNEDGENDGFYFDEYNI